MADDGKVIRLPVITTLDLDPDVVLEESKGCYPGGVLVVGWAADGSLETRSSMSDGGEVLWLLEKIKGRLLNL